MKYCLFRIYVENSHTTQKVMYRNYFIIFLIHPMNLKLAVFRDIGTGLNAHEEKLTASD